MGLGLSISQCENCSKTYVSPTVKLSRLRTILRDHTQYPHTEMVDVTGTATLVGSQHLRLNAMVKHHRRNKSCSKLSLPHSEARADSIIALFSGRDSDLEAFSLNPSDVSFAPLAFRPGTYTKYPNLRFLSY